MEKKNQLAKKIKDKQEIVAIVEKIQLALSLALGDKSNLKYTPKFFGITYLKKIQIFWALLTYLDFNLV